MKILVTYGSKRGGTAGLARMVGRSLRGEGLEVDVKPPREVSSLKPYDGVIVGGALYGFRWHGGARRFVRRHARQLRERPVWFFSSGPLDSSAEASDIPPIKQVRALMDRIGVQGHATFGGRLSPNARGLIGRSLAKRYAGDWRDERHVYHWANAVAMEMRALPHREHPSDAQEGQGAFHLRWIGACALAELLGIGAAAASALAIHGVLGEPRTGLQRLATLLAFAGVGAVEGAWLGALQWRLLRRRLPLLSAAGWIGVTLAATTIGWVAGMAGPTFAAADAARAEPGLWQVIAMAAGSGIGAGALLGGAQWLALRAAARQAGGWIGINALAWIPAMAAIAAGGALPAATWPAWAAILTGAASGLLGGALLGAITGFVARRLEPRQLAEPRRRTRPATREPLPA